MGKASEIVEGRDSVATGLVTVLLEEFALAELQLKTCSCQREKPERRAEVFTITTPGRSPMLS